MCQTTPICQVILEAKAQVGDLFGPDLDLDL